MKAVKFDDNEGGEFQKSASNQFLKGYDDTDGVYDEENPINNYLPENVKAGIEHSRKQAEAGTLTPHDEVMKKYAKYL